MAKSIFRYPGGKAKVQKKILARAPKSFSEYREPFVGGGGIFFGIDPVGKRRWINDMHPGLIAVYKSLRDRPIEFIKMCKDIPAHQRGESEVSTKEKGKKYNKRLGKIFEFVKLNESYDQAFRYFFLNRTVWMGRINYDIPSRLYYSVPEGWDIVKTDRLEQAAVHVVGTVITCGDYLPLLEAPGEDVWIYCFAPGSLVRTHNEEQVPIENVKVSDILWGNRKVSKTMQRHFNGKILSIKVQGSPYLLTVTPEHPVLRVEKRKEGTRQDARTLEELSEAMKFTQADDLKVGDYVCVPNSPGKETSIDWNYTRVSNKVGRVSFCPDDELIGELIGLYLAEGHTGKPSTNLKIYYQTIFSFGIHETDTLAKRVKEIVKKVFGIDAYIKMKCPHPTVTQVYIYSRDVTNFIEQWVQGKIAYEKRCNDKLMIAPLSVQKAILMGWLRGDGGIDRQRKGKYKLVGTSTSKRLALQMYHIALRCGLRPSFKLRTKNPKNRPIWDVYFSISEDIRKLGWNSDAKRCCATRRIVKGYVLSRVKEINHMEYSGNVYNLRVDGDHLLCVDNIVTHNCDPPYVSNTDMVKQDKQYQHNFTLEDHEDFVEAVKECKHRVCISYDDCDLVREWFDDSQFAIYEEEWKYSGTNLAKKKIGQELIITNY